MSYLVLYNVVLVNHSVHNCPWRERGSIRPALGPILASVRFHMFSCTRSCVLRCDMFIYFRAYLDTDSFIWLLVLFIF